MFSANDKESGQNYKDFYYVIEFFSCSSLQHIVLESSECAPTEQ